MKEVGSPLRESQRLQWIDAARGFAILGIFMVNVPAYNAPFFIYGGGEQYWNSSMDRVVQAGIDIFFQASFYTLFSFLFGFGMQIIVEKLSERQLHVNTFVLRRLGILIIFGLIHAFLIWHGDILLSYGIIGLLLVFFFKRKNLTLVIWALCLLLIPTMLFTGLLFLSSLFGPIDLVDEVLINQSFENYGNGTLMDIWQQNLQDWLYANDVFTYFLLACNLLPLFLLGMFTARKKWLHDVNQHKSILKRVWIFSFLIFMLLKAGPHFFGNPYWFTMVQDYIGGSTSAIFYLTTITLAFQKESFKKILYPLTYVGKMSLSNYIFQSIVCFIVFYSVGFGLYGKVSPLESVLFVLVVFTIQVFLSKWWLTYYQFGPLEWVWRRLMYLSKLDNKRQMDREQKRA
ncbi:DUF418 domain-containing protein [Aquibacillus koreensis]|uniref:DUF418 domain-containing protein n=1 Tax=Aquibacillus koreensis TaxID=279446 RepID=A0A9X3WJL5_9BACI|nr:DUF418 domain-containing protein [Aquibacillus koreensis]MCT2535612.1 DUF418 domain-containing protein [Aquibacillus koreensis]MDC3420103.1 DUF418 domain-containing protein [Aquibacillus koreensis]